jgi:hypothetical protein
MLTALVRASLSVLCFAGVPEPGGVLKGSSDVNDFFATKSAWLHMGNLTAGIVTGA